MTSKVIVSAHCESNKEVHIRYMDNNGMKTAVIQDGETFETVVYDDRCCSVKEAEKREARPNNGDGKTRPKPDQSPTK